MSTRTHGRIRVLTARIDPADRGGKGRWSRIDGCATLAAPGSHSHDESEPGTIGRVDIERSKGATMRLPKQDIVATVLVAAAGLLYLLWAVGSAPLGLGSTRATGLVVLGLGFAASASAVVPNFDQLIHGNKAYLAVTSLIGRGRADRRRPDAPHRERRRPGRVDGRDGHALVDRDDPPQPPGQARSGRCTGAGTRFRRHGGCAGGSGARRFGCGSCAVHGEAGATVARRRLRRGRARDGDPQRGGGREGGDGVAEVGGAEHVAAQRVGGVGDRVERGEGFASSRAWCRAARRRRR